MTLCSFDVNLDAGVTANVQVWAVTGGSSYAPVAAMPAAWTLLGQASVTSAGLNVPTPLNLGANYTVSAGTIQCLYVVCTTGTSINYTNGIAVGNVLAADANLTVFEGIYDCSLGLFSPTNTVRNWNGNIQYLVGAGQICPPPPPGEWQVNRPGASLAINNAADPGAAGPMTTVVGAGSADVLNISSSAISFPWDLVVTLPEPGIALSAGGISTVGGQTVNLDFAAPSLTSLNGLVFAAPFLANLNIPLNFPVGFQVSAQTVHVDPAAFDLFSLSHLNRYEVEACSVQQDFDNLVAGNGAIGGSGPYPVGWSNGGAAAGWQVYTGTTPSTATGPLVGAFSGLNYMYCETSGGGANSTFTMDTCVYDATTLSAFTLSFNLSRLGVTIGTLNVLMDDGSGTFATTLASYTGAEPTGLDWTPELLALSPLPASGMVAIRFEYLSGTSFTGDLAIDSFLLQ